MKLFDVILKLIRTLTLVSSEELAQLTADVNAWTSDATPESEDKMKALYAKVHKGVALRLAMPFAYFFLLKWVRDLSRNDDEIF